MSDQAQGAQTSGRRAAPPGPSHVHALAQALQVPTGEVVRFFDEARPPSAPMTGLPGQGLRGLRRARGLTGAQLAESVQVPAHAVYNWERGGCRIPSEHAVPLAAALGMHPDRLRVLLRCGRVISPPPRPMNPLVVMRLRQGLSQTAAADRLGVGRSTLRQWERGKRPPLFAVRGMASLYSVPITQVARAAGVRCPRVLDPSTWSPGDLSAALRALREWSGLTQRALAERCGAALDTVRAWENDRLQPSAPLRRRLEAVYKLPKGALLAAYRRPGPLPASPGVRRRTPGHPGHATSTTTHTDPPGE